VDRDEVIAELESEKATFEINAEQAGILKTIAVEGDTLKIGDIACSIDTEAKRPEGVSVAAPAPAIKTEVVNVAAAPQPKVAETVKATPVAAAIISDKKLIRNLLLQVEVTAE
jgi:2-oxoglutarate dehydrogenase E2 component (dihydrolipoamide succinyltransferase)